MEHILDNAYTNWRVPLSPSTDNHSFKQILAKLGNTATLLLGAIVLIGMKYEL